MKKFIRGTFELDTNVTDVEAYEKPIEKELDAVIDWANRFKVAVTLGTSESNKYLCEYKVTAQTKAMCNGLVKELKNMLKKIFPKVEMLWQGSGDCLY